MFDTFLSNFRKLFVIFSLGMGFESDEDSTCVDLYTAPCTIPE